MKRGKGPGRRRSRAAGTREQARSQAPLGWRGAEPGRSRVAGDAGDGGGLFERDDVARRRADRDEGPAR